MARTEEEFDVDGAESVFDRVRRLSAFARFEPDEVDPGTLIDVLEAVGGRYRRSIADAIEHYAAHDPEGIAAHREELLAEIDDFGETVAASLARAVGRTAAVDPDAVDPLVDRIVDGNRQAAAAEGIAVATDVAPGAVVDHLPDLVAALSAKRPVRDPLAEAIAELIALDVESDQGPVRPRVSWLLDSGDPGYRAGTARTLCLAAARGNQPSIDELPRVIAALESAGGSRLSATEEDVVEAICSGLAEVAADQPHALVPYVQNLLAFSTADEFEAFDHEPAIESILADVASASEPTFESLLDRVDPGISFVNRVRSAANGVGRARGALAAAAPHQADAIVRRKSTVKAILDRHPGLGAELIRAVARDRPADVEWAIDPLVEHLDGPLAEVDGARETADALAALTRSYPMVAGTVVDRLVARDGREREGAVLACRSLAERAPATLIEATGPHGTSVVDLLVDELSTETRAVDAAFALAALGMRYPESLEPVAEAIADALRASSYDQLTTRHRAINVLAGVTIHAAPETMHNVGLTVLDQVQRAEVLEALDPEADGGVVTLLGALCCRYDRYAEELIDWLEADDVSDEHRRILLSVFAEAAWPEDTVLADHLTTFDPLTRRIDDEERAAATRILACAVGDTSNPPAEVTARLVDLVYDLSTDVRRWAVFGVGEWLASSRQIHETPLLRLKHVADADRGTSVASLALVRSGHQSPAFVVDKLEHVGRTEPRPLALAAVEELATIDADPATAALERVAQDHPDTWVRSAAYRAIED